MLLVTNEVGKELISNNLLIPYRYAAFLHGSYL